ncbi:MAG TPA: carboxypeptidase-like regulatory domain-containing protein [Bryobacteraceae bacterium]|nr:carboxypeptidase-like regulatory domain-containing protein [Bryobacteraceae bacterium]
MRNSRGAVRFVALLASALAPGPLSAQVVGASLSGVVTDASHAGVPQVTVTVRNKENGSERRLLTDNSGRYSAPSITIGTYVITAAKSGFASQQKSGVNLVIGQSSTVDFELPVGEIQQVVTVEEAPEPVAVTTQQTSGLVNEKQVKELPLNGRSYDELMTLNPSVVNYTPERSGGVGSSNSSVGNMFSVSGRRPQENLFLLNGVEYTSASLINLTPGGASGQLLGVDAVREFNVVTDTYGAEYGKRPGAQISIVTASGTNDFHGSLYEFIRNSDLDARNFFDQGTIPQFQRNNFGVAAGGPIRKQKTFIFGNFEGYNQHLGLSDVTLVPDKTSRAQAVPSVVPLLSLWPVQNGPELGGGIAEAFSHPLQTIREDFGTLRVDQNFSDKDTLFGVYTIDDSADNTPTANPLSSVVETLREQVASVQEQHVFSPAFLNTVRIGYSRAGYFFTGKTSVDIPGWLQGDPIGAVVVGGSTASNGASQISQAGTNTGDNITAVRNLFTYDDHFSILKGIHQIEGGVWFQEIQANDDLAQYQWGQASFTNLQSFLQGSVSTFTVAPTPTELGWRSLERAGFIQDEIRPFKGLDIRVGFRVESTNGWNEAHGRAANYLFNNGVIDTNPITGGSVFMKNRAEFLPEPRVGIAWDPFGHGRTVVHAGFGIYHQLLDLIDYRTDQTAPFNATYALKSASVSQLDIVPGASLPTGSRITPSNIQPDAYTPSIVSWTFKVEQKIASNTSLSIGYVGSHGYHEMLSADANEPFPTVCPASPCPSSLAPGTIYNPANAKLANPNLANSTTWLSEGVSSYNALQVDVNRHFANGFQLRGVYTFSKSLDDGSAWNTSVGTNAPGFVMYPGNPKLDYGPSTTDVPHMAVINGTYELPFGPGKAIASNVSGTRRKLVEGWSVSAIETLESGFPFTPQLGFNPSNNGDSRNPVRPSVNPAFTGNVVLGNPNEYFNPYAFIVPANGTYGNLGRDTLRGPGLAELDFSVLKNTTISERVKLQFRAEAFNILNRANFTTPNTVVYSSATTVPNPTAGAITSTATTSRQLQFGLKLLW